MLLIEANQAAVRGSIENNSFVWMVNPIVFFLLPLPIIIYIHEACVYSIIVKICELILLFLFHLFRPVVAQGHKV